MGKFREQYEAVMLPIGKFLSRINFQANVLTLLSVIAGLFAGLYYSMGNALFGALILILAAILDMFDGAVARARGSVSRFGAVLDHVLDRYVEFFVVVGMVLGGLVEWFWGLFTLFGMIMASFTRAKAESVGGLQSCAIGLAERQEKLLILLAGSLLATVWTNALAYAVILIGVLSQLTVVQRLHFTWRHAS